MHYTVYQGHNESPDLCVALETKGKSNIDYEKYIY